MAIQKTEAFILRTRPFRTSSLILTAFSSSFGKIKGMVKGARKEGGGRPGLYEPFNLVEIVFYEKTRSEIHLVSETTLLETFEGLRRDLETLSAAYYFSDLVDQLTETEDPHRSLFELLHFAFQFLPSFPPSHLTRLFEIRLLHETGFLPHWEGCLGCGEKNPDRVYFSVRQGAIFCARCQAKSKESRPLNPKTLEAMRFFIKGEIADILRRPLDPQTEREMKGVAEKFLMERLGRPLASRRFLNQVESLIRRRLLNPQNSK